MNGFMTKLSITTSDHACRQSVEWNLVRKDSFLSSSWDDTVKVRALHCAALRPLYLHIQGDAVCFLWSVVGPASAACFSVRRSDCVTAVGSGWSDTQSSICQTGHPLFLKAV